MKHYKSHLGVIAALVLVGCTSEAADSSEQTCTVGGLSGADRFRAELLSPRSRHVMVAAHRACWQVAPENSLAAIAACIAAGVDMVELDVRRSSDGVLVIVHDATLDRTTEASGAVADYTADELSALHLREGAGGPNAPLTGETLPLLRDALAASRGHILVNIDAKEYVTGPALDLVEAMGMGDEVLMKAVIDPAELDVKQAIIRDRAFFMPILWERDSDLTLPGRVLPFASAEPVAFEVVYDDPGYLAAGRKALKEVNARIWVNTMLPKYAAGLTDADAVHDPASVWGVLVEQGANMIQTDRPFESIDYLESIGRRCGP